MTSLSDDQELERLGALHLAAAHACLEHWRTAPAFLVDAESTKRFNATYPVVAHAMAQVVAALSLHAQGLGYAARANIRVAFEHALAAQWVIHTHEGEEALIGSMSRLHRNVVQGMRDGGVVIPENLQADLNHPVGEPQLKIQAVADRFDGGTKGIYGLYRHLTGAVHVSLATLAAYIDWRGEDHPPALRLAAEPDADPDQLLVLGWSPVLALSAIESLRSGHPYLAKIRDLAAAHELVPDLGPFDTQPHLQHPPSSTASSS
ncbi:hypothetical protein ACQP2E_04045 [Actinoplanes sp. CA-015351]|uniref:hypothetical protein n=1 Tax=Actinoplanes sp. CA-015351 TaxID=3239897 RepID=UPI003D953627